MSGGAERNLRSYLEHHWAAAGVGSALAHGIHDHNADTAWAHELALLADQVDGDDETLLRIRAVAGIEGRSVKRVLGRLGEVASRLARRGIRDYSPLARVAECEAMMSGVMAKHRLWVALGASVSDDPRFADFDFSALRTRADDQLDVLGRFHEQASMVAFSSSSEATFDPTRGIERD